MSEDAKKIAALELALKAKTEQLSALHKQMDAAREAIASLESERAANAILTAEIEALRAHQRQDCEPVAWLIDWPDEPDLGNYFAEQPCLPELGRSTPLYAAPPKREPLSDEQIEALNFVSADRLDYDTYEIDKASVFDFARAIERAVLEKLYG